jgi:hypothetical protein
VLERAVDPAAVDAPPLGVRGTLDDLEREEEAVAAAADQCRAVLRVRAVGAERELLTFDQFTFQHL